LASAFGCAGTPREGEAIALKLVGISFILLAIYVAVDAVKSLFQREPPEASYLGIAIAALSLVVMPYLATAKRRVAAVIQSRALQADSRQTDILRISISNPVRWLAVECSVRLVVG
jgi:Cation efflux family